MNEEMKGAEGAASTDQSAAAAAGGIGSGLDLVTEPGVLDYGFCRWHGPAIAKAGSAFRSSFLPAGQLP